MPGAVTVERTVYHADANKTLVRDVSEDMLLLEPDQSPLLVLTNKNKRSSPTDTPKFEWFERAEVPVWDTVAETADLATTATTVKVTDVTLYVVGDLVIFPLAATSGAMDEVALVGTVGTNNIQVTRGLGGTTAVTIGSSQSVRILSGAMVEGGAVPLTRSADNVAKKSYTAIFRDTVDISRTREATKGYVEPQGPRRARQMEALARHKQTIEAAGLWSAGSETLAAAGSTWTTQGVKPTITTNITNAATTFTLTKYNDFCESAFRYGASEKLLMAAPKVISALNYFSQNKLLTSVGDKTFGVAISRLLANGFGEFLLANNFRMGDGIASKDGFLDEAYSIDLPSVAYRYLAGNGNSQNTKLYENVVQDGKARTLDEYYTQAGFQVRQEKKHARIHGVTQYA